MHTDAKDRGKGLQEPMSKKTNSSTDRSQEALLAAARAGDQKAFESLLDLYEPLIASLTLQFAANPSTGYDREDLHQEAALCFFHALMHFDPTQTAVSFGMYAKICMRNGLISYLRNQKKVGKPILLEDHLDRVVEEPVLDPADRLIEQENYEGLSRRVREELSDYENRIWWLYLAGRTAREIATQLGTDEKSVQNAVYRIRRKLRAVIPYSN